MDELNGLFRDRIGISKDEVLTFASLDHVLEKTSRAIPFENLCVVGNRTKEITKENLANKIIKHHEGGLCYELNALFYLFLVENGFQAALVRGVTFDQVGQRWSTTGKTHVTNLITHDGQPYLVDTGFGGNLPLKPVPLNGNIVTSDNGEFRVERVDSEHGDHVLYMKLRHKDTDWKLGYMFDSTQVVHNLSELNEIQNIILEHPASPFNKRPLVTRMTERGNMILTDTSFTEWVDGQVERKEIDSQTFQQIAKGRFGISYP